ncbi:hypothetical protein HID58_080686 [Brassica napus]|uniref:Uncharacterized protein n=1 Tax=Brassica napus TaxID=3708 RepID=A0ABQ7Y8R1_BRANA|nr:hypothetical protein HID58_080686 [Brassica napus]
MLLTSPWLEAISTVMVHFAATSVLIAYHAAVCSLMQLQEHTFISIRRLMLGETLGFSQ